MTDPINKCWKYVLKEFSDLVWSNSLKKSDQVYVNSIPYILENIVGLMDKNTKMWLNILQTSSLNHI